MSFSALEACLSGLTVLSDFFLLVLFYMVGEPVTLTSDSVS